MQSAEDNDSSRVATGLLFPFNLSSDLIKFKRSCHLLFGPLFSFFINFSTYCSLLYIIGPACHCGRSRLFPSSTFSTSLSLSLTGPACHCGRSRLFTPSSPHLLLVSPYFLYPTTNNQHFIYYSDLPQFSQVLTDPYKPSKPLKPQIVTDLHRSSQILTEPYTHTAFHIALLLLKNNTLFTLRLTQIPTDPQRSSPLKPPRTVINPHRSSQILTDLHRSSQNLTPTQLFYY